jgi:CheY-like chemotaxis protein
MPAKILIADDDFTVVSLLRRNLEAESYEVISAHDGKTALHKILTERPDVAVLDNLMPGMTGYEIARAIRTAEGPLKDIPIIIVSAQTSMEYLFEYVKIFAFVCKPIDLENLLEKIKSAAAFAQYVGKQSSQCKIMIRGAKILVAGIGEFLPYKIKEHFEALGAEVQVAFEDAGVLATARSWRPDIIFAQYWEGVQNINLANILDALKKHPDTRSICFVVFAVAAVAGEAKVKIKTSNVVPYEESADLLQKLETCF